MKILMALMGLDIGGAETHVVELSKELKKRGYDVLVVSNGGVYEKELSEYGIRCFNAPLHKRSISLMRQSYKLLENIIKEEKPDIVHAHARIPGMLCGMLKKKYGFKFVTTAHGVFRVNFILKKLTNWGEKTLAVSDDIKTYLMVNYGISENNITVTVNGIDTDKFSMGVPSEKIVSSLGLDKSKPIVAYVSRLDGDSSLVAKQLITIAPELNKAFPGIQFIITGGGDDFENIKAMATEVNKDVKCIFLTGPRCDINEIVSASDLFVGVSRSALEAMAEEKPVLLAGSAGYLGIFTEEKTQTAISTNFCFRGCEPSTKGKLFNDITAFINMGDEYKKTIGAFGRKLVIEHYSVKRMADDCEEVYK